MTFEDKLKRMLKEGVYKLFDIDKMFFDRIAIEEDVIENIRELARQAYPKEFVAFFHGRIKDKALMIDSLLYHEYVASEDSAMPIFHIADKSFYGTVHSHPSNSNRPSREDIRFFHKMGIVHCIICKPFLAENIQFYNMNGEEIEVNISD